MKTRLLFIFIITLLSFYSTAQTISGFTVIPANPTESDTVMIIIENYFTSGGCEGTAYLNGVSGSEISAGGLHCMGMLSVICTDYDTIILPPLTQGQYTFIFVLSTGQSPGCIPGIIPIDIDSTHITVTGTSNISPLSSEKYFVAFPNPSNGQFNITNRNGDPCRMKIYSSEGKLVQEILMDEKTTTISLELPEGVYSIVRESGELTSFQKLVILK